MKRKTGLLIFALVFILVLGGAAVLYNTLGDRVDAEQVAESDETELSMAPDFTVYDAEGNAVKLSDFRGKPVVLNFWASWCGPCKAEMPDFDEMCAELEGEVVFMMVNATDGSRETVEIAKTFIDHSGYTFPVYYDTAYEANYAYGVTGLPTTFFIDAEGYLVAYGSGAMSGELLQKGIDMITGD